MKRGLFLDDERSPEEPTWVKYPREDIHWVVVTNYKSFTREVDKGTFDYYSFDHDLQDYEEQSIKEYTGMDCIKYLVEHLLEYGLPINNVECFFHTKNPVGEKNMRCYWESFVKYTQGFLYE